MREYDLKKALSTGSYTRNSIKPQLLVAEDGEYRQGDILDANATMEVVSSTASDIDDKINDILGVDNGAVQELVGILSDSDTTTGILNELAKKANISDLETVVGDIPQVPTNVSAFTNDAGYLTQHQDISGKANSSDLSTVATSGSYNDLSNKPNLANVATSGSYEDLSNKPHIPEDPVQSDWTEDDTTDQAYIKNKPNLATVATTGDYTDLSNKPTIPAALIQSDWAQDDNTLADYIKNKPNIPAEQIQSDWNQSDTTAKDYIKNKPTIPTIEGIVIANGHEYVDLGLPSGTKWAKCNVGADSETGYGNYYGYGKGSTLYNYGDSAYSGTENPLALNADTAAQVMGGGWRTPTKELFEELLANTTLEWTTINNVYGTKLTASNNNYIFFPAAGWKDSGSVSEQGAASIYWSSTPTVEGRAYGLYLRPGTNDFLDFFLANAGRSVRGVIAGTDTLSNATQSQSGLMSSADKTKLDELSTVATTGSYNDLTDKPTIPTKVSDLTNNLDFLQQPHSSNGHEYVEIGGIKWATENIGAAHENDPGLYFAWGETEGYRIYADNSQNTRDFSESEYKYAELDGSTYVYTKYNSTDGKSSLDLEDDAARANWGGNWRIPTRAEFGALFINCVVTIVRDSNDSPIGFLFTDKTDSTKSIYFPGCRGRKDGVPHDKSFYDSLPIWTNQRYDLSDYNYDDIVWIVSANYVTTNGVDTPYPSASETAYRYSGRPVRAILDEPTPSNTAAKVAVTGDYNDLINKPSSATIRKIELTQNLVDQTTTISGQSNDGKREIVIYDNNSQNNYTVSVSTTYKTLDGDLITLSVPPGCYCEVYYINIGGTIFAKGIKQLANS